MKRGVPERSDVLHLSLDPTLGREQQGSRHVLVLTVFAYNKLGLVLVAPITQGGGFAREHGFAVSLSGAGAKTQGIVLCHQVRMLDYKARNAKSVETLPDYIVDDVLARVRALLD